MWKHNLPNKTSLNNTTKKLSSDMQLLIWILGEKLVLFKKIPQHAVEDLLQIQKTTDVHTILQNTSTYPLGQSSWSPRLNLFYMPIPYFGSATNLKHMIWIR